MIAALRFGLPITLLMAVTACAQVLDIRIFPEKPDGGDAGDASLSDADASAIPNEDRSDGSAPTMAPGHSMLEGAADTSADNTEAAPATNDACSGSMCCTNACTSGATQCISGSSVQTCTLRSNGCTAWSASACGGASACSGSACAVQLVAAPEVVIATVGLPVSGPMASITDANTKDSASGLTASIDWGDGSPTSFGIVSGSAGSFVVTGTHTYSTLPTGGQATIAVTVTAPSGATVSTSYSATVRPTATATITETLVPTPMAAPLSITAGSDGAIWFTEYGGPGKVGRLPLSGPQAGTISEYTVSIPPYGIASGTGVGSPIWFTEPDSATPAIWQIATGGALGNLTETPVPSGGVVVPWEIVSDGNGYMWFTDPDDPIVARISTTDESIMTFTLPNGHNESYGIAAGGGFIWVTEGGSFISRVSPSTGDITEYPVYPVDNVGASITVGGDGNVWFLQQTPQIGSLNPTTGVITQFTIPAVASGGIVAGPDGNLWYTDHGSGVIRMTPTGAITQFATPTMPSTTGNITVGPDGALWFVETAANKIARIAP